MKTVIRWRAWRVLLAMLMIAMAASISLSGPEPARAAVSGPIVLMGIDDEDGFGGQNAHGDIANYVNVVTTILANVKNGGSGILVIGGGKSNPASPTANDFPTKFWTEIGHDTGQTITFVNKQSNANAIANRSFAGFAMLAIVGDEGNTPRGLTQ